MHCGPIQRYFKVIQRYFKVLVDVFDVEQKCHGVHGTPHLSYIMDSLSS